MDGDTLSSSISYDGRRVILPEGSSHYCSNQPLIVYAGSTSIITIRSNRNVIRTLIGSYVNNVRRMREPRAGDSRMREPSIDHRGLTIDDGSGNMGRMPPGVDLYRLNDLKLRGRVDVDELTIPPGQYEITVVIIISPDLFLEYCEDDRFGTNAQICGRVEEARSQTEAEQYKQYVNWFFFQISTSIVIHVVLILLIIIIVLHRTNSL